ncbi:MAG TPA: hypothetical protein VNN18_13155 [Candidatus Xenobia bacterium]|nr:hypothetical protein [Candidatus Xenobia bacterium]
MRIPARLLAIFILLLIAPLAGCNKLRARDELNKGVRAYKNANYEQAVDHFRRAIEYDPNLINARLYLATAYASQFVPGSPSDENRKNGEAAIAAFEEVLQRQPDNATALAYVASLYYGMAGGAQKQEEKFELFEKSKEYRRKLIAVDPNNPEHYYSIGVIDWTIAYARNQEARAKLGNLAPDKPLPPRERRALAAVNGPLVEEGQQMLEKALALNPKYLDALAYINLIWRQKADIVETPQEREEALDRADEYFQRYDKLRQELQQAPPTPAPAE